MATAEQTVSTGEVVLVGRAASVQFAGWAGFAFRVVSVDARLTYAGWVWLDGYQLDSRGRAVARRRIFVRQAGLGRPAPARRAPSAAAQPGAEGKPGRPRTS